MRSLLHALFAGGSLVAVDALATDWPQWGFDPSHSANNTAETAVSAANVAQLEQKYAVALTDGINAAPVFAEAITTSAGMKDLLFTTAQSGRITALDAADGSVVWTKTTAGGNTPIESSPAIDPDRQYVYSYGADGKVHKYAIGTGNEVTSSGWPQTITLKPGVEKGASALATAVSGGVARLYAVTNGYVGDGGDYQGHLVTIDLATGTSRVFNSMCSTITTLIPSNGCNAAQSGIWGRPGAVYDAVTDRVYITCRPGCSTQTTVATTGATACSRCIRTARGPATANRSTAIHRRTTTSSTIRTSTSGLPPCRSCPPPQAVPSRTSACRPARIRSCISSISTTWEASACPVPAAAAARSKSSTCRSASSG
jgi:hypothetical protein